MLVPLVCLLIAATFVSAQTPVISAPQPSPSRQVNSVDSPESQTPAQQTPSVLDWTYGGFLDVAYLRAFNDPPNKLFRSRGTAWHVNDFHLNMCGAYIKKKATDQSRWGAELLVQTGKDDEIFGFSATAPNRSGAEWLRHLGPTNVSYMAPVGRSLTIQGGIFGSLVGYDSLYAKDNFNYTRPWGADFTPYLMLGVNASYPFTEKLTGTFYVVNGYWHLANANGGFGIITGLVGVVDGGGNRASGNNNAAQCTGVVCS